MHLPKRNHTVVVPNFFGEGKNLEAWQLGWQQDEKVEAKSSVSKKILDWRYGILFFLKDYSANSIPQEDFGG